MKTLFLIAALTLATQAQAADIDVPMTKQDAAVAQKEHMTLQQQIAADAKRDPYAESTKTPILYQVDTYEPPAAAEFMQPSEVFEMKNGNTVVKQ